MDTSAVVVCALLGLVAGWFVVVRATETFPEPLPLDDMRARVAVTVVNGLLWAGAANTFRRGWVVAPYCLVFSALLAVSVVDLRLYRIPNRIVFPALAATIVLQVIGTFVVVSDSHARFDVLERAGMGLLTYFGILFAFHLAYPKGMGFGDVKLALLMGTALGWISSSLFDAVYFVLIGLLFGCVLGIVFGLVVRVIRGRGGAFPFGPALALSTIYMVLNYQSYLI
jgi:prepilin signal peptidase PulO-like enzyme (type II secretory pathway)